MRTQLCARYTRRPGGYSTATARGNWAGRIWNTARHDDPTIPVPYPDLLQIVFHGTAAQRDGDPDLEWTDTDGYELRSYLTTIQDARARTSIDLLAPTFLDLLAHRVDPPTAPA